MAKDEATVSERVATQAAVSIGPGEVSDELRPRIDELGLWDAVEHFREHGYAIIREASPPALMDELREAIHTLSKKPEDDGRGGMESAVLLLGRHPAVDRVATLPKIMAFAEFSVGKAMRGGRFVGSIKRDGGDGLALHADQNWIPTPFPEHNLLATFCFACEGMTEAGGSTCVVPGSHRLRRTPTAEEVDGAQSVPIETEKGDVAVWDGAIWHGSYPRKIPGTRTVLHATYQRLYTQPIDDFTYLLKDEAYMATAPEGMRQLLGADLFFHTATPEHDVDMEKFQYAVAASKL
ncbi:uncharacterized protein METZ01_LOCUS64479 [marine metagenome]|uniref:Phytanoyl-CoA dioxygenase family protein n=1 Tax=marine metagenome TaxID=408172 RepID=A0A381T623_9ZZZZ